MPWKGEGGFVAPGRVGPAGNALLELVEDWLPQTFYVEAPAQWWTVAGPALVARAARTLHSTLALYEHRCDLDAATLTRTLIEQPFTFAYLAHDPAAQFLSYESADHEQALSVTNGMHRLGYTEFPTPGWPSDQLGARPAPLRLKTHQLADQADDEWPDAPRLFLDPGANGRPFRTLYESIYKPACRAVHGKAYVTARSSRTPASRPSSCDRRSRLEV